MAVHKFEDHGIYYERHGEGRPLVIFNGIMMQTESWHALLPMLTKSHQVILVDFPDQGRSDSGLKDNYTLEDVAWRMVHWIEAIDLIDFDLLGISYGGEVALHLVPLLKKANRLPQHLILANTTLYTGKRLIAIGDAWKKIAKMYDAELFYDVCMPDIYSEAFYEAHHSWLTERKEALKTLLTPEWFERFIRLVISAETHDARGKLDAITMPTLIIGAQSDTLTPIPHQLAILEKLPHATLKVLEGAGHASMYEAQGNFCALINAFINPTKET